ncbi:hypothetical protein B0J11DRAFT_603107 [Dendryphion nanum]|uniref:Uncharacterized protein n=1 Tax=Dendryphion nanum TaxID=256645 RepID=A0A9P9E4U4_9PLEO|nr:hypothetical protein B0J11DRAFT_603107 [Dendryphion nanum]
MYFTTATTLLALSAIPLSLAAECGGYGLCGVVPSASRNQLYAIRQHVCGDTDKWRGAGSHYANGGCLRWPNWGESNAQQVCWDAFENILNQCRPEGSGLGYHYGSWTLNGKQYSVSGCSNGC